MAAIAPWLAPSIYNLGLASATTITAGSADTAFPVTWLRDAVPSKRWRSKLGWNFVTGFNTKIDVVVDGVTKVATITAGNYASGSSAAAAVQAALAAAATSGTWTASYDAVTKKFSAGSTNLGFKFLFSTGANVKSGAGVDLGFAVTDTTSGSALLTAGSSSYHSREYVLFDLGSSMSVTIGIAHGHNLSAAATVTLIGSSASTPWATPGTSQALAGDDLTNKRLLTFTSQGYRYWAMVFSDVQNSAGYTELGVPYVGTYWVPARAYDYGHSRVAIRTSLAQRALDGGAVYMLVRKAPKMHRLNFRFLARADRDIYQAIEDAHGHVFLAKDPLNFLGSETTYGVLSEGTVKDAELPDFQSNIDVTLSEDLG